MQFYSTKNKNHLVSLKDAVLNSLPEDGGLYMPAKISPLSPSFIDSLRKNNFVEIAFEVAANLLGQAIDHRSLFRIVEESINFQAPLVSISKSTMILELFHGPSLAFKDFGARFMAQLMSHLNALEDRDLTILVATSGDTGGAVAAGFYNTEGIQVKILYPKGKVSDLQEKQLVTWGGNIQALEIDGTFDDCQNIVKKAFLDPQLNTKFRLCSANSINIARLIPQSFYYFEAFRQLVSMGEERTPVFSIPSGNYGNLTAGIFAWKLGLPVKKFIAASNANDAVPRYLDRANFLPLPTIHTISNAMDVGNPSNFERLLDLFEQMKDKRSTWNNMQEMIWGYSGKDESTRTEIKEFYRKYGYVLDPHSAVGSLALKSFLSDNPSELGIILETAHPSKFPEVIQSTLEINVEVPARLAYLAMREKIAVELPNQFTEFKDWLMQSG